MFTGILAAGRTGKEGIHAAFAQAGKHQRERVAADLRPHNNRVDHQSDKQHTAKQYGQQLHITGKRFKTGFRNGRRHQAENTQRCKTDNPLHNRRNGIGQVGRHLAGRIRTVMAQSRAQYQSPSQNADIVGIGQRVNRVPPIHQQRFQHFDNGRKAAQQIHRRPHAKSAWSGMPYWRQLPPQPRQTYRKYTKSKSV